jgi:hypothetical protein
MSGMTIPPNMAAIIALALIGVAMLWVRDPVYFQQAGPPKKYKSHYVHRLRRIGNVMVKQRRNDPVAGVIAVALLAWAAAAVVIDQKPSR